MFRKIYQENYSQLFSPCSAHCHIFVAEVYGVWKFWLRLCSCFGWICSDSAWTPTHFKVLYSDSCSNSKVNYLNFWQCLNDRIGFRIKKTKKPYQTNLLITAIHVSCFSIKDYGGHNFFTL